MEIKTLNEQIERLRELIRKCYATVAGKNGTVPEVGERNMENLPAAIASTHDTLEELTITQNGEYTPQEGVDGFSKVVAEFDPSSLPKVKVSSFAVTNSCINEDGIWEGERLIDTSECTTFSEKFYYNTAIKTLNASGWDTSKVTSLYRFGMNSGLQYVDFSGWDTSNVTSLVGFIYNDNINNITLIGYENFDTRKVTSCVQCLSGNISINNGILDFRKWELPNATDVSKFLPRYNLIKTLVGGESIESVIANNTTIFKGLKANFNTSNRFYLNDRASLRALINGLADLTGQTPRTLTLSKYKISEQTTSAFDTLTEEDIAIAVAKNWTITSVG